MRRILDNRHDERRCRNALPRPFQFEYLPDLEAFLLQFARVLDLAGQADRIGAARQQFHKLTPVLLLQRFLVDKKLADKLRSLLGIEISREIAGGTAAER